MYTTFYRALDAHHLLLPIAALFVFVGVFTLIVVRALARPEAEIQQAAALPLDGGDDR